MHRQMPRLRADWPAGLSLAVLVTFSLKEKR